MHLRCLFGTLKYLTDAIIPHLFICLIYSAPSCYYNGVVELSSNRQIYSLNMFKVGHFVTIVVLAYLAIISVTLQVDHMSI